MPPLDATLLDICASDYDLPLRGALLRHTPPPRFHMMFDDATPHVAEKATCINSLNGCRHRCTLTALMFRLLALPF